MVERRSLTEGLTAAAQRPAVDPRVERTFVQGATKGPETPAAAATPPHPTATPARVPVSTRVRSDLAAALKRASLQRQLDRVEPNTLQDILEEALEPWLRSNGYLR